jgi:putative DNA primase/helicase
MSEPGLDVCPVCLRSGCENPDHRPPPGEIRDHRSELGAAERFARLYGNQVRYDHRRSRWLCWEGHRWRPDADATVMRLAMAMTRQWQREAFDLPPSDMRKDLVKFTFSLERRSTLMNALALAKALKPIADAGEDWDANPWLLSTPTGVVDLHTGTCHPGQPRDRLTLQTAARFVPTAPCLRWDQFLREIFNGEDDLVTFMQRAVGYSLVGVTTEQVLFLLYGTGANGKGTFANTLKHALGDYAWNMPFTTVELHERSAIPNDLAALVNRRFVTASETNEGTRLNEARVKALTGCDPMTARFLHSEFFEFEPVATFWLSVNHRPIVRDDSYGFWRRIRLVPFTQRFALDTTLAGQLDAEASGILAWAVRGALAWQADGLAAPDIVIQATKDYEAESDPLRDFLDEACDLENDKAETNATVLYKHYKRWADRRGLTEKERLSQTMFWRKLGERYEKDRDRTAGVFYLGLAIRPLAADASDSYGETYGQK